MTSEMIALPEGSVDLAPTGIRRVPGRDRRRLIGWISLGIVLILALIVFDPPTLDTVRLDIADSARADVAAARPIDELNNCFQGFCFDDGIGFFERWWSFSTTFLRLMSGALALALLGSGIVSGLLSDRARSSRYAGAGVWHGPSIVMTVILFSTLVAGVRIAIALLVAVLLAKGLLKLGADDPDVHSPEPEGAPGWRGDLRDSASRVATSTARAALWVVPGFLVAAAIGGLGTQYLTEEGVSAVVGDHLLGIAVVAAVGLVIGVPRTLEIPLVAAALLLGMGTIAAAVLLFAAGMAGPVRLRRRGGVPARRLALGAAAIFGLVFGGGAVALAAHSIIDSGDVPTVAYDGESCTYQGPRTFEPGVTAFRVVNQTDREGDGDALAAVVGRLPDNVTLDHFTLEVNSDPRATLPTYFVVYGSEDFVFPGTEKEMQATLHRPGAYTVVCMDGGGNYVVREFSMLQPEGWFGEFRNQYHATVADSVFYLEG
jgi:hypothetical protein